MKHVTHWIDGKPWDGDAGTRGDIYNPATGQVSGTVDFAGRGRGRRRGGRRGRGAAAAGGRRRWSKRAAVMFAFRELIQARRDELAALISAEHGKVALRRGRRGGQRASRWSSSPAASRTCSRAGSRRTSRTGVDAYSIRQPVGVVAGITPFNFPAMVPMWMFPIAIACGNTFVLKPSEKDPSASLLLAELLAEAGLPDGVFNVVHGGKEAVDALLDPPRTCGGQLRRVHADRPVRLRDRRPPRASGCRRWAGPRTTWSCCPTPTWTWPRTPRCRPASGPRASAAWRSRWWSRSTRSATSWSTRSASGWPKLRVGPGDRRDVRDGPAGHRGAPGQGRLLPGLRRRSDGAALAVDGREHPVTGGDAGRVLARARACSTTSPRR